MTATAAHTVKCGKCHRVLTSAKSIANGTVGNTVYGPTCLRNLARDTAAYSPEQTAKAVRLVEAGGVTRVPSKFGPLFETVGSNGRTTYWTSLFECSCQGFAKHGDCYHVEAARIVFSHRNLRTAA